MEFGSLHCLGRFWGVWRFQYFCRRFVCGFLFGFPYGDYGRYQGEFGRTVFYDRLYFRCTGGNDFFYGFD